MCVRLRTSTTSFLISWPARRCRRMLSPPLLFCELRPATFLFEVLSALHLPPASCGCTWRSVSRAYLRNTYTQLRLFAAFQCQCVIQEGPLCSWLQQSGGSSRSRCSCPCSCSYEVSTAGAQWRKPWRCTTFSARPGKRTHRDAEEAGRTEGADSWWSGKEWPRCGDTKANGSGEERGAGQDSARWQHANAVYHLNATKQAGLARQVFPLHSARITPIVVCVHHSLR